MTYSALRRPLIAGITILAAAAAVALPMSQADAAPKMVGLQGYAGQYFPTMPIRNSLTVYMTPRTIMVRNFLGYCGEYTNVRGTIRNGRFNVSRQFANGWGIAFKGTANYKAKTIKGKIRLWAPEVPAVADDPATPEIDETQAAQPACDSGFKNMIRMKPMKGPLF